LKDNLKLQKDKIDNITKGIISINNYSENIKTLLVFFKGDFWKSIVKVFYKPSPDCIYSLLKIKRNFQRILWIDSVYM